MPTKLALFTLTAALAFGASAAPPVSKTGGAPPEKASTASERFEIGSMLVERSGTRGRPLILIPGLASGAWVWQDTVKQLKDNHAVYVVTFAGFDGRPAVPGKQLEPALAALRQLIVSRKLHQPVLIGHSLGGSLALAVAGQHPHDIGGVVSIDGLPVVAGTEELQPVQREQLLSDMRMRAVRLDQPRFAEQQKQYMRVSGVLDMTEADTLAELTATSDPATVSSFSNELLASDFRQEMPNLTMPVLLIAPFFARDNAVSPNTEAGKQKYYLELMHGTPQLEVLTIAPARSFAMVDQPERFNDMLDAYLKKMP